MRAIATTTLTAADAAAFERIHVPAELLEEAGVRRVTDAEARDAGIQRSGQLDGILFPYLRPTGEVVGHRLRRDHPDVDPAGKPKAKYLSSFGDRRHFYILPADRAYLQDVAIPTVFVEAEKSKLAITAIARAAGRDVFAIALGGCYGWSGKIGMTNSEDGTRVDVRGPLSDFDHIVWTDRRVVICFDSNAATNPSVQAAERGLCRELIQRGAHLKIGRIPEEPGVNGPDDYIAVHGADSFLRLLDDSAIEPWPEPQPVRATLRPVEPLPPTLIPEPFQEWLTDVAERMGCPLDFVVVAAILGVGSVIGAGCGIRPKQKDDWIVVPNLWGGAVGRPGVLKTPALEEAIRPLERLAAQSKELYDASLKDYQADLEMFKAHKEAAKELMRAAAKGKKTRDDRLIDPLYAKEQYSAIVEPPAPVWRRHKTNDATVEKLGELLADNPRGLLVFRDELIGLLAQWDREGREGDRSFFLESWNGTGSHETDRISRGSIRIEHACVSILGGIQPAKLTSYLYGAMRGHDNDGLLQRLQLLVYPDPPPTDTVVDRYANTSAKNSAFAIFQTLAQMDFTTRGATQPDDGGIPYYRFDPEAQQLFYDWFNDLTRKLRNDDEPIITEHLAKFRSLMPALALIFHLIDVASDPTTAPGVSEMAAKRAAAFCEYLETHARRIYALVTDVHIEAAARLSKRIQGGELGEKFTLRDVYRREWGLLTDRNIVESACDYLVDLGWLRVEEPTYTTGRPRSPAYAVNPRLTSSSSGGAYPPHPEENL